MLLGRDSDIVTVSRLTRTGKKDEEDIKHKGPQLVIKLSRIWLLDGHRSGQVTLLRQIPQSSTHGETARRREPNADGVATRTVIAWM
jgi:hypothetical protein